MAIADQVYKILDDFGTKIKEDLQQSLRDKGVTQGGGETRLSANIKFDIKQIGDTVSFKLMMPEYGEAVDKGRKPAPVSKEGQANIAKWGSSRGYVGKFADKTLQARLKKQSENKTNRKKKKLKKPSFDKQVKAFVYVVSRSIKNKGTIKRFNYKGSKFYSEVVNDGRLIQLKKDLTEVIKDELQIEIIDLTKI